VEDFWMEPIKWQLRVNSENLRWMNLRFF
jgi:hypothetical protein